MDKQVVSDDTIIGIKIIDQISWIIGNDKGITQFIVPASMNVYLDVENHINMLSSLGVKVTTGEVSRFLFYKYNLISMRAVGSTRPVYTPSADPEDRDI